MKRNTFDRLKLSMPSELITILNESVFTITLSGDGLPIRAKYEQTTPFYYSISINYDKKSTDIEFSGKVLLDNYPTLINYTNITNCFENINYYGICYINPQQVLDNAYVKQCDVTCDISSPYTIKELYHSINLGASKRWCIRDITSNRFTIESTNTTKRFKSRLIIYDKGEEMCRKPNQNFLSTITNSDYQMAYFKGRVRFELNLNSLDRIKYFFNVSETSLSTILYSTSDPIAVFLSKALAEDNIINQIVEYTDGTLRELEHLLLLASCDYNLNKAELLIRGMYGTSRSIKRSMEPYVNLLNKLKGIIPEPEENIFCIELSSNLKYLLSRLKYPGTFTKPDLKRLYQSHIMDGPQSQTNWCTDYQEELLNIDYSYCNSIFFMSQTSE